MRRACNIIACDAVRDEVESVLAGRHLAARTSFLDSSLHFDCTALEQVLTENLQKHADAADPTVLVFGECYPGIDATAARYGATRVRASNCIAMLLGEEQYTRGLMEGQFFLTSAWLSGWRETIEKRFGLDAATARELFSETATAVVYLETLIRSPGSAAARAFARYVDLPLCRVDVGLENLAELIEEAIHVGKSPP